MAAAAGKEALQASSQELVRRPLSAAVEGSLRNMAAGDHVLMEEPICVITKQKT